MGIIVVPQLVAGAIIGTNVFALTTANSKLHVVNASNPSAMTETTFRDLRTAFAVAQFDPSAIVSHPASNRLYVQNASEGIPKPMIFAVYNVTTPGTPLQQGTINLGTNLFIGANGGNDLVIAHPIIYSLLGGDITTTSAQLNAIDVTLPAAPVVVGSVFVGTFSDKPRKLFLLGSTLYVLSGTTSIANQKVFVYDVSTPSTPVLTDTILLSNAAALVGVRNFFASVAPDGSIILSIMCGTGSVGNVNLVVYNTDGTFLGSALVTTGVAGTAIAQAA